MESEILTAERELRQAVLAGDVEALDRLLADDVLYVDPDGASLDKAADLQAYRSGDLKVHRYDPRDGPQVQRVTEEAALLSTVVDLAAEFRGVPHAGTYRYTRLYVRRRGRWQVVFAQAAALAS